MSDKKQLEEKILLLEKKIDELENKQKIKNQFFATTVHELRTPLNAIVGLSTVLMDSDIKKPQSEYISQIHSSSELLVSLVNDILDFSKIEAGKIEIESINFSLDFVMDNIQTILSSQAKEKGLELIFDIDENIPQTIASDPLRLTQIIINLTSNAIKFTDKGSVTIKAKTLPKVGDKEYLEFHVTDTGIGLSPEQQDRLFKCFVQADSSISRQYGGSGLGLSISKKLSELMGGTIRVESQEGKGSDFIFTIELKEATDTIDQSDKSITQALEVYLHSLKDAHILMAEDNTINQSVVVALLKDTGIDITMVNNGKEAIEMVEERGDSIDLILMDINMPVMGGLEATTHIRNNPKYVDIPIIAFSGDSSEEIVSKTKDIGMDDILLKPIVIKDFYQVLKNHLKSKQTIEQRYIESAKHFDEWLNSYRYQKIASLISSIKKESQTTKNENIIKSALNVENRIEKYKNLFLVLIKNHTRAVNSFLRCVHTLQDHEQLTDEEQKRLSKTIDKFSKNRLPTIIDFASRLDNATQELIALVNILEFHKATEFALSMQKEAKSLGIYSIDKSISPIVGIATTQRKQLKEALNEFKAEIEKIQVK